MKERLIKILDELKAHYEAKELEVNDNNNCDAYTYGELKNRKQDILKFETFISQTNEPTLQSEILEEFRNSADRIKADIDKIKCEAK